MQRLCAESCKRRPIAASNFSSAGHAQSRHAKTIRGIWKLAREFQGIDASSFGQFRYAGCCFTPLCRDVLTSFADLKGNISTAVDFPESLDPAENPRLHG